MATTLENNVLASFQNTFSIFDFIAGSGVAPLSGACIMCTTPCQHLLGGLCPTCCYMWDNEECTIRKFTQANLNQSMTFNRWAQQNRWFKRVQHNYTKYRDHDGDQHINGNQGSSTNSDDTSAGYAPRLSYAITEHGAYGHSFSVVAIGPPHSLVFQSFLGGDTETQPIATETTKRQCITATLRVLGMNKQQQKTNQASNLGNTPTTTDAVTNPQISNHRVITRCKHCGGNNLYTLVILSLLALFTITSPYYVSGALNSNVFHYEVCMGTGGDTLFHNLGNTAGAWDLSITISMATTFISTPSQNMECAVIDNTDVTKPTLHSIILPINSNNQQYGFSSSMSFKAQSMPANQNLWFQSVSAGSGVCCSYTVTMSQVPTEVNIANEPISVNVLTFQPVNVTVVNPLPLPVNVTNIVSVSGTTANGTLPVQVNVTALLGQLANPESICHIRSPNGTVISNYTCVVPKLLEVLPPDTASGPTYLGRPQTFTWTNFSGNVYPNFNPFNATTFNGSNHVDIGILDRLTNPNSFTPDVMEALASAYVAIRRRFLSFGYSKQYIDQLAAKANKAQHSANGNSVQTLSDQEFEAYCLEAASKHGSVYHYVFNHLAYDSDIPDSVVAKVTDERLSDDTCSTQEHKTPSNTRSGVRHAQDRIVSGAPVARDSRKGRVQGAANQVRDTAPRVSHQQYDIVLGRIAAKVNTWPLLLAYIIRNIGEDVLHLQRLYHRSKLVDDGSVDAGLVSLLLRDDGASIDTKMRLMLERGDTILRFSRFECPLLSRIRQDGGWEEVEALHRNSTMHAMVGNGKDRYGECLAPPTARTLYVDSQDYDSDHLLTWLDTMSKRDAYFMVGSVYASDRRDVLIKLVATTGLVRIEAYFRGRGGVPDGDSVETILLNTPTSAPPTPLPAATGTRNTGATKAKDGIRDTGDEKEASLPTSTIMMLALENTFAATSKWSDSLFYTTVNSITGLLQRYAQSIKLTSSLYNNVGFKSCMNNYGMYFGNYMVGINEVVLSQISYTTVDPSGPGNTAITYSQAGQDLVASIATNNMLQVSQNLRIQTVPVNGTALYQAMTDSRNVVSCGLTGSFASIFYRIFANIYSMVPMVGTEHAPLVANTHIVLPNPIVQDWLIQYWPLTSALSTSRPTINAMVCTYSEFTGGRFGNLLFSQPQFGPNNYAWGDVTAVVPITVDMLNSQRGAVVAAWIMSHLEYPWRQASYSTTLVDDNGTTIGDWPGVSIPAISCSRCRGPIQNVLLVISGINTVQNAINDISVTVGTGAGAVRVSYANNYAVGAGGLQIDIAPGLDSIYDPTVAGSQVWLEALNTAYMCYGNESDIRTALMCVADSGTRIAPPAFTAANLNLYGYVWGTSSPWNFTGLTDASVNGVGHNAFADGITCPLNMATTVDLEQVQRLSQAVCRIGQFNPLIAVDMVNGMYRPTLPPASVFPQSTAAIASCISRLSRMLTVVGDAAIRDTGISMNYLFNPAAARALSAGNVNVLAAWRSIYDGINKALDTQTGGALTYLGSWFADYNPQYWISLNTVHQVQCAIGRVPSFYMKYANISWDAYSPELAKTQLFGEFDAANFGFPNAGNPYERIMASAPPQATSLSPYDILSRLSPMFPAPTTREPLEFVVMTKGGGDVVPVAFPNMYPSVGRSPTLTLRNFGIITYLSADLVDPPVDGTIPVYNPDINNEIYPGFYGNSYGYYTRAPQVKYNKHEIAMGDMASYTIIQNASGAPTLQARLDRLSGRSGN